MLWQPFHYSACHACAHLNSEQGQVLSALLQTIMLICAYTYPACIMGLKLGEFPPQEHVSVKAKVEGAGGSVLPQCSSLGHPSCFMCLLSGERHVLLYPRRSTCMAQTEWHEKSALFSHGRVIV